MYKIGNIVRVLPPRPNAHLKHVAEYYEGSICEIILIEGALYVLKAIKLNTKNVDLIVKSIDQYGWREDELELADEDIKITGSDWSKIIGG